VGEEGGFTNNSCIDSLYYTNSQGGVNTTNAHRNRKKAFEQVVTTGEEKLLSRLLHEYEKRASLLREYKNKLWRKLLQEVK
jgi:hypothetical protein